MSRPTDRFTGPLAYAPKRARDRDTEQGHISNRGESSVRSEIVEAATPEDEWLREWVSRKRAVDDRGGRRRIWSQVVWFTVTAAVVMFVGAGSIWGLLVTGKLPEALGVVAKDDRLEAASFENRFSIQDLPTTKTIASLESDGPETGAMELRRAIVSDTSIAVGGASDTASLEQEARLAEPLRAGATEHETEQRTETRRSLSPDQVAVFLKRGQDLIANGDIVAARVILLRVAEAGDPRGALELAATFDPIVLKKIGAIGMAADLSSARYWYGKAEEFGSEEASRRLQLLAGM